MRIAFRDRPFARFRWRDAISRSGRSVTRFTARLLPSFSVGLRRASLSASVPRVEA